MTTPTPETSPPFDPLAFPTRLRDAQRKAADLYAELHDYQRTLPWSREPHPGWDAVEERGKERSRRPATDGWTPEQIATYDILRSDLRDAAAPVNTHGWWSECKDAGADLVATRQALKRTPAAHCRRRTCDRTVRAQPTRRAPGLSAGSSRPGRACRSSAGGQRSAA
ncbi:hypothetical protein ACFWN1_30575 [Streptomyces sp. NPDC058459]|uniref:hypothetical protein n=1 Tax=Streptomyces sp. NPDC058459 TaxID=3346508 RepID=UPI00364B7C2D